MSKFKKSSVIDQNALVLSKKYPLQFLFGSRVHMDNRLPSAGLDKLGIKIVDFRIPKKGEFFISQHGSILYAKDDKYVNMDYQTGYRFILETIKPRELSNKEILANYDIDLDKEIELLSKEKRKSI